MERIKHNISEYKIPNYIEDILVNNYCRSFIKMTIIRDHAKYQFSYNSGIYKRLKTDELDLYSKMILLRTIIVIAEMNEDCLIKPEEYLIEPELIYSNNNGVNENRIKIMFYPDFKKMNLITKMKLFADKIINIKDLEEINMINKFKDVCESEDINKIKNFLDKNIGRIERSTILKS